MTHLTEEDRRLIVELIEERNRLKRQWHALSNARIAEKFEVSRTFVEGMAKTVAEEDRKRVSDPLHSA